MTGIITRLAFYPTLLYNVALNKLSYRDWYHRIDDAVILGALPFRSMTKELVEKNVKGVVTMTQSYENDLLVNSKQEWASAGIEQLHIATADFVGSPSQTELVNGVTFIENIHRQTGGSVYVHCKAGRTRSATMVACYLMKNYGLTPEEAFERIRSKRHHVILRRPQWNSLRIFHQTLVAEQKS